MSNNSESSISNSISNNNASKQSIFDGRFYETWSIEIRLTLSEESLWPLENLNERAEYRALKILYQAINRDIIAALGSPLKPLELWARLKTRYGADRSVQRQVAITTSIIKETLDSPENLTSFLAQFRNKLVELRASGGSMTEMEACTILLSNLSPQFQPFSLAFQAVNQSNCTLDDLCAQLERLPVPIKSLGLASKSLSPPSPCPSCGVTIGSLLAQRSRSRVFTAMVLVTRPLHVLRRIKNPRRRRRFVFCLVGL